LEKKKKEKEGKSSPFHFKFQGKSRGGVLRRDSNETERRSCKARKKEIVSKSRTVL
jgi:hypothetical protein